VTKLTHPSEFVRGEKGIAKALDLARALHILHPEALLAAIDKANTDRWIRAGKAGGAKTAEYVLGLRKASDKTALSQYLAWRGDLGRKGGAITGARCKEDSTLAMSHVTKMLAASDKKKEERPEEFTKDRQRGGQNRTRSRCDKLSDNAFIVELPQTCKNRRIMCALCQFVANQTSLWDDHTAKERHKSALKHFEQSGKSLEELLDGVKNGDKFKALSDVDTRSRGKRQPKNGTASAEARLEEPLPEEEFVKTLPASSTEEPRYFCMLCEGRVGRTSASRAQWIQHIRGSLHTNKKKLFDKNVDPDKLARLREQATQVH
jgi:hypothetical protein